MFTVCPKCALTLVVTAADLRVAQGYVRCGRCSSVFNALAQLSDERGTARDAEDSSAEADSAAQAAAPAKAESAAKPASAAKPQPREPAREPPATAGRSASKSAAPPAAANRGPPRDIDVEFSPTESQSAPPPASEEGSVSDIELEFNPEITDAASVFVAASPSPEWTAATGSFKALVAGNQEPAAPEPKPPAPAPPPPPDEDIDVELDAQLLSDIVSEAGPPPPSALAPTQREVAAPSPLRESALQAPRQAAPAAPRESAPPAPRQPAPAAPRESAPPTPRQAAPAAPRESAPPTPRQAAPAAPRESTSPAPRPTAPPAPRQPASGAALTPAALEPPSPQPQADQKRPTPITPIAPAGAAKSAAPAAPAGSAAPAKPAAPPAPAEPTAPPGPTRPAVPAPAATATTPKVATEPALPPAPLEAAPEDSDAEESGGFKLLEAAAKSHLTRGARGWAAGAAALALLLIVQIIDHHRDALATDPRFRRPLTALYSALGVTLTPRWDLRAYDVRQLGASVGQGSLGAITVRASIRNTAPTPQPMPLLRVTLQDRFGNRLASRDVPPRDYLPQSMTPTALLSRDQRIDAELAFVDPGANAVGFELDACLPMRSGVACANDVSAVR